MELISQAKDSSESHRGIILMYHRIAQAKEDNWLLNVSPAHFEEQMVVLKKYGIPMALQDIITKNPVGEGKKGIVVTFDDGYADNLYNAKPVLERHDIPATFFIVSGIIDSGQEYWWDELEKIIFEDDLILPEHFRIGNRNYTWPRETTSKNQLLYGIGSALRPLHNYARREFMDVLRLLNGKVKPQYLPLTYEELLQMASCGLFEIGAHTVSHPTLATLDQQQQEHEIAESKEQLEEMINRPVNSFAYPYGSYCDLSISLLQKLEFECACTVTTEPVHSSCDPYQLPRFAVRDWDGDEFEKYLQNWL